MESRLPKLNEIVGAYGHYNAFRVIAVDSESKTVDLLVMNSPTLTLQGVSFTVLLLGEPKVRAAKS